MTGSDIGIGKILAEAERLGKEQERIDERNRKRRAKGRKPLPDIQERKDLEVARRRHRTGDNTTIDAADAIRLFEVRMAEMNDSSGFDGFEPEDDEEMETAASGLRAPPAGDEDQALRAAEAARRVQDLKSGRIDHQGNFSDGGQKLAGGDQAAIVGLQDAREVWRKAFQAAPEDGDGDAKTAAPARRTASDAAPAPDGLAGALDGLRKDLYERLGTSFEALERTLSDMQGRIAEIVTASTPPAPEAPPPGGQADEFKALLERRTPVVFDVNGTQMTFDAICVFHAPPCITLVSRIGSAKITPKPGATLNMTYEMDGEQYDNDPVVFLGTRFDLPMFGLSFVGFIRMAEGDMLDAAAGAQPESSPS